MKAEERKQLNAIILVDYSSSMAEMSAVYSLVKEKGLDAEGMKYFLEREEAIGVSVGEEDKETLNKLTYYYERYKSLIHGMIERLASENPPEDDFYQNLWQFIENSTWIENHDEDRLYAWFFVWKDSKIPYFRMEEGKRMSDEQYGEIVDRLFTRTAKVNYILHYPYEQKTQRASQLLDLLDECETPEDRCVLMAQILRLKDQIREPLMEKLMDIKKILEEEI